MFPIIYNPSSIKEPSCTTQYNVCQYKASNNIASGIKEGQECRSSFDRCVFNNENQLQYSEFITQINVPPVVTYQPTPYWPSTQSPHLVG